MKTHVDTILETDNSPFTFGYDVTRFGFNLKKSDGVSNSLLVCRDAKGKNADKLPAGDVCTTQCIVKSETNSYCLCHNEIQPQEKG